MYQLVVECAHSIGFGDYETDSYLVAEAKLVQTLKDIAREDNGGELFFYNDSMDGYFQLTGRPINKEWPKYFITVKEQ